MGQKRSGIGYFSLEICVQFFIGFILISAARISLGYTNPGDVLAMNKLYTSLGSPALPGWVASAGDPCGEAWQGVQCNNSYIESIVLNAVNLRGQLGEAFGTFAQIKAIDLSNNQIGGSIPTSLPVTLQNFFLSANQLTGSIPSSLGSLTHLTDMSVNDNLLTGELPDAFQALTGLINLDLSGNNLSGQLPPSVGSLLSLTTLHVQNNQLSGTLDVLQNLSLQDLNVENNLFSGPIPEKLLSIPNFKQDGNLFNSSTSPLSSPASPTASPGTRPPSRPFFPPPSTSTESPATTKQANGPSALVQSNSGSKKPSKVKRIVWISIAAVFVFIVLVLAILLCTPWCLKRRRESGRISKQQIGAHNGREEDTRDSMPSLLPIGQVGKGPKGEVVVSKEDNQREPRRIAAIPKPQNDFDPYVQRVTVTPKPQNMHDRYVQRMDSMASEDDLEMDLSGIDMSFLPPPPPPPPQTPPPPPPPPPPTKRLIAEPIVPIVTLNKPAKAINVQTSARSFSIASLQLYTDSFSQDNLIGVGMLGSVYKAQLPDGKLLAVKKLDKRTSSRQKDDDFLELVDSIDKLRHANIVELKGYCSEHGQKLLIYEYCSNGSLHDAMHSDDEFRKTFSWNTRVRMALGAARALEYLHEVCQPPVVHRNFKSANVLLDDDFAVCVSDCGLASLISSGSVSQLSGHLQSAYGYGAPEFESGIYTYRSDVYSFGVVMLELLTGRKPYDRMRTRGEQSLVRWAIPQLHDIDALSRMVDPSLKGEYPAKSLSHFADIISRCVQPEPEFRPLMSEVVQDLLDIIQREPNQYRPGSE